MINRGTGVSKLLVLSVCCAMFFGALSAASAQSRSTCASAAADQMNAILESISQLPEQQQFVGDGLSALAGKVEETEEYDADVSSFTTSSQLSGQKQPAGVSALVDKVEETEEYDADVSSFTTNSTSGCTTALYTSGGNFDADVVSLSYSSACDSHVIHVIDSSDFDKLDPNPTGGCSGHIVEDDEDEYTTTLYNVVFHNSCTGSLVQQRLPAYIDGTKADIFSVRFPSDCSASFNSPASDEVGAPSALALSGGCQARISDDLVAGELDAVELNVPFGALLMLRSEGIALRATLFAGDRDDQPLGGADVLATGTPSTQAMVLPVAPGRYWLHLAPAQRAAGSYQLSAWLLSAASVDGAEACSLP